MLVNQTNLNLITPHPVTISLPVGWAEWARGREEGERERERESESESESERGGVTW